MKKFFGVCILLSLMLLPESYAARGGSIVRLDKTEIEKPEIELQQNNTQKQNDSLLINNSEDLSKIIDTQKEHDIKDLEILWKATIENNQVVEFALKKLATPESQRRIHSSLMAKTLSAIVAGASFVPSIMGTNYGIQTAAFSAGRLAQGLLNRNNVPNPQTVRVFQPSHRKRQHHSGNRAQSGVDQMCRLGDRPWSRGRRQRRQCCLRRHSRGSLEL